MASLKFTLVLLLVLLCAFLQSADAQFFSPWGYGGYGGYGGFCGFHCRRMQRRMFWNSMLWG